MSSGGHGWHEGARRGLALPGLALLTLLILPAVPAWGRHHRRPSGEAAAPVRTAAPVVNPSELEPPPAGEPGAPDYEAIGHRIADEYRRQPAPSLLYELGVLARLGGRRIEAQDLMRRYLADPLTEEAAGSPQAAQAHEDAERVTAQPPLDAGEVQVLADQDGLVAVDGRLLGALPLPLPLLLPVGPHVVALEMRDKTMRSKVKVLDGRGLEMRFNRESGAVLVTVPPAVVIVPEWSGLPVAPELQRRVQQLTEQTIARARLAVYGRAAALRRAPNLGGCLARLACQVELAAGSESEYLLRLELGRLADAFTVRAQLVDAEVGDVAAAVAERCPGCRAEQVGQLVARVVQQVLKAGHGRPHGTLSVRSEPPGAEVRLGGRLLGRTPCEHALFTGTHELTVTHPEYTAEPVTATVSEGKRAEVAVTLASAEPPPLPLSPVAPPARPGRPRWRLAVGGVALGVGLVLTGFGISGIVIDGSCVTDPTPPVLYCREHYDTLTTGAGLLGAGLGLSVAGAVLLAVPGSPAPLAGLPAGSPAGLALSF